MTTASHSPRRFGVQLKMLAIILPLIALPMLILAPPRNALVLEFGSSYY
jgi:hypothetical protein